MDIDTLKIKIDSIGQVIKIPIINDRPPPPPDPTIVIIMIALTLLTLVCFAVLFYFLYKLHLKLRTLEKSSNESKSIKSIQYEIQQHLSKIKRLEDNVKQITNDLIQINTNKELSKGNSFGVQRIVKTEPEKPIEDIFYLSMPNSDGSFNESSSQINYKEGASIYKLSKSSGSKAKFWIDERENSIKLALQFPDKNIDPVCEAQNALNIKATKITTDSLGEVELIGDKWVLIRKAKISYV